MDCRQRYTLALARFFTANPQLAAEADDVSVAEADAAGVSLEDLQGTRRAQAFERAAHGLGSVRKVQAGRIGAMTGWRPAWQSATNSRMQLGS